jgi:hypothetical protein
MSKQGRPQIIEVIQVEPARPISTRRGAGPAPEVDGSARTPDDDRHGVRRWWIAPVAVAAIAAVVIGASIASSGDSRSAVPSGSVPTVTGPATPPVLPLVPVTPLGYQIRSVTTGTSSAVPAAPFRELWATHGSSQTSSWLEITAAPIGDWLSVAGDMRIAVPAGVAVLDGQSDGLLNIRGPIPGGGATVSSSGVSRATIGELFASLELRNGRLAHYDARLGGMFQEIAFDPDGSAPLARRATENGATLTVEYATVEQPGQRQADFAVTIGPVPTGYSETSRRFFLSHSSDVVVDGQQAVIGNDERTFGRQSVVFQRAGLQIAIDGTAPRSVLLDAVNTVHVATGSELAALMATPPAAPDTSASAPGMVDFASGHLSNGNPWSLRAGAVGGPVTAIELGTVGGSATRAVEGRDSTILTVTSSAYTALVAYIPHDRPDAWLVVTVDGIEHVAKPAAVGDALLAGYAFDQLVPFTAQIRTADGRALSTTAG